MTGVTKWAVVLCCVSPLATCTGAVGWHPINPCTEIQFEITKSPYTWYSTRVNSNAVPYSWLNCFYFFIISWVTGSLQKQTNTHTHENVVGMFTHTLPSLAVATLLWYTSAPSPVCSNHNFGDDIIVKIRAPWISNFLLVLTQILAAVPLFLSLECISPQYVRVVLGCTIFNGFAFFTLTKNLTSPNMKFVIKYVGSGVWPPLYT